jgi:5-hydroxyisourate hydrolase
MSFSTHVLDAGRGAPAADLPVVLYRREGDSWSRQAAGTTDGDGRWPPAERSADEVVALAAGVYRVEFDTGRYFTATGQTGFYPAVDVTFEVVDPARHHHVPLLLSAYAYSTYRGS